MQTQSIKSLIATFVLLAAIPVLAGCTAPGGDGGDDTIRIGTLLPITGDLGAYGPDMERAALLAADHINAAGGINGRNVEIVTANSASNPTDSVNEMNRLVNTEGVVAVVGAAGSTNTISIMPTARDNGIPVVSPASTSPALNNDDLTGGFFFRVPPSDALQGAVMARLLQSEFTSGVVHSIYINNDYGNGFNDVLKSSLPTGITFKGVAYDPDASSFASVVQEVCSGSPTAIVLIGYVDTGSSIMKEAHSRGCTDTEKWYFSEGVKDEEFVTATGKDEAGNWILAGFKGTAPSGGNQTTAGTNFATAYTDAYPDDADGPGLFADNTYEAVMWLALAMQKAGSNDGNDIKANLRTVVNSDAGDENVTTIDAALTALANGTNINWNGPAHSFDLDENNEPATGIYLYWRVNEQGQIETVQDGVVA